MPIRYYPSFRIRKNLKTNGGELSLNGEPYSGPYYVTFSGEIFSGPDPITGPNEPLESMNDYAQESVGLQSIGGSRQFVKQMVSATKNASTKPKPLVSHFPNPIKNDYDLGYIDRYFAKQINNKGYITEISPQQYTDIKNGAVGYDVSIIQAISIRWKLTGPLNAVRISQFDVRAGIVDTNKRLVEAANPNFFGLVEFIGGNYSKFARPTQ